MKTILRYCYALTNIGVETSMSYIMLKRIHMVNLIALICFPSMFFFSVTNLIEGRHILASINFINAVCTISVLFFQLNHKHNTAKITLLATGFILFTSSALLYRNGGEYFLVCILIVTMLLYDSHVVQWCVGIGVAISILCIHSFNIHFVEPNVPHMRALFNITSALAFIVVAVIFFKQIIYNNTQKIEQQRLKLLSMNRDKEKVFSIIAHDIRSPFAALENMVCLLREQVLSNEVSIEFINQLHQQIAQQNQALEDLLQWSSLSMQGIRSNSTNVPVRTIIDDIIRVFEPQSWNKNLSFDVGIQNNLKVLANSDHLVIIFRNLISNAIKFSHTGGKIEIYSSSEKPYTYIHIKDHGVGMQQSQSTLLFHAIQKRSVGTKDEPGAGFGLVLCKDLLELNNGTVQIESMPNQGSIFTIGLPSVEMQA